MIAVRGKRLGGGTLNQAPIGQPRSPLEHNKETKPGLSHEVWVDGPTNSDDEVEVSLVPNSEEVEVSLTNSEVVEVTLREEVTVKKKQEDGKVTPSLADLAAEKDTKKAGGTAAAKGGKSNNNPKNPTGDVTKAEAALQQANAVLEKDKAFQERFIHKQKQILAGQKKFEEADKKQRRRSTLEESNKNKKGVLEWIGWKRPGDATAVGLVDSPKEASGPRPVNRRRHTVTLHQAWVSPGNQSLVDANAKKQGRRSTFEESNKNKNGVLEWTAWKRGSDTAVGLEQPKEASGPKPVNRRRYTVTVHQAWVSPVSQSLDANTKKQMRRSTMEESNKNKNGVLEWTAWKRGGDISALGLEPEKEASGPRPVNRRHTLHQAWVGPVSESLNANEKKQRRRSTLEESNKNNNGILEWTAWKRGGDNSAVGLEPLKEASGPRPVNRRHTVTLHQAWVGSASESHNSNEKKQRRRSSIEQSNRNKNGVLEWTAWKRPGDAAAAGLDTTSKPMAGPRPVKRESVRSNVYHVYVDADGVLTKLPREFVEEEEKKKEIPEKQRDDNSKVTGDCEPTKPTKEVKNGSTSNEPSTTEKMKSWISKHKYHLLAAGVVTVAAIGVKMAFGSKKESTTRTT